MPTLLGFVLFLDGVGLTNTVLRGAIVQSERSGFFTSFSERCSKRGCLRASM